MAKDTAKPDGEPKHPKQGRSPAYPGIDLKTALAKAKAQYDAEGKYPAPMPSAFKAWGYGAKSSGGRETRAALRYFGLVTVEGDSNTGKVKLTEKALRALLDEREDQTEKRALIREFALTPPIHKRLLEQYPDGIKSDATAEHFLMFEESYNKTAASELVAEFKATADYAGLFKPANVVGKSDASGAEKPDSPAKPGVGDLVQVEIGGIRQLEKAARVRAVQQHDGQEWIFIEGSETGIPMAQVIVEKKAPEAPPPGMTPPRLAEEQPTPQAGMQEEKNSLDEGEATLIWPENLSPESVRDLEYWLTGILNKAKRRAGVKKS